MHYPRLKKQLGAIPLVVALFLSGGLTQPVVAQNGVGLQDTTRQLSVQTDPVNNYGDLSVDEALLRYMGVNAGPRGEVNLRGTGFNRYNVTMNGLRLPSTGLGDRSVDLTALPMDGIQNVQWFRVLSADMDADAMAGTINLQTNQLPIDGRSLNIRAGGGANPYFFRLSGPASRGAISYSERVREDLTLNATISYFQETNGWEGVQTQFSSADFGTGPVDVIERVSPYVQTIGRENISGSFNLMYRPDEVRSYFVSAFVSDNTRSNVRHFDAWNANGNWISPEETGASGAQSSYQQSATLQNVTIFQHAVQAGGSQNLDVATIDYSLGWTRAVADNQRYEFPFILTGRNLDIDMTDRFRPTMTVNNFNLQADGSIDRQFMVNQNFDRLIEDHTDNRLSARVDATIPTGAVTFKTGASTSLNNKTGNYADASLQFIRVLRLNRFNFLAERNFEVLNNDYNIPWLINTGDAQRFTESQRPQFNRNENVYRLRSEIWNYDVDEQIHAAYAMADAELIPGVTLRAGLRAESVSYDASGRRAVFRVNGAFDQATDTSRTASQMDYFPNVQLVVDYGTMHSLHLAFSRSVNRPDYNILAPFELYNPNQSRILRGNPQLKPEYSTNLDLFYTLNYGTGRFDLALFSKQITDMVILHNHFIEANNDFNGWTVSQYQNSADEAFVYGAEVSLHQNLSFLPGILQHFAAFANYTWTDTSYELNNRDEDVRLPGHSPHVFNGGLSYAQGRFYIQAAYHWSAEMLVDLGSSPILAPSVNTTDEIYMDTYQNGWRDLTISATFRISDQFRFWVDARNLLTPEYVQYQHTHDLYPIHSSYRGGTAFQMGIRFDL